MGAPAQDVCSLLVGFLPLLLLCGTKHSVLGVPEPGTPALATSGQGQAVAHLRGARCHVSRREERNSAYISFTQEPWGRETAVSNSSDGETEARRCRDLAKATNHVRDEDEVDSRAFYHMPLPLLLSWSSSTPPPPPPTCYIHKQDSPSLDTCHNSKATLKAWATVRVTAWA